MTTPAEKAMDTKRCTARTSERNTESESSMTRAHARVQRKVKTMLKKRYHHSTGKFAGR